MRELAIVFFVLTLVLEVAGALIWWSSYRKSRKGVSAQATVVERVMLGSGERGTVGRGAHGARQGQRPARSL